MLSIRTNSDDDAATNFCESHSRPPHDCVRNVTGTNRTDQTDNKTVIYGSGTNYFNYVRNTNDRNLLIDGLNDSLVNETNFAPWEWMINYDANRYGVWFIALIIHSLIQFRLVSENLKSNKKRFDKTYKMGPESKKI